MKRALLLLLLPALAQAAEHDHAAPAVPAGEVDHSAHTAPAAEVDHSAHSTTPAADDHSAHSTTPAAEDHSAHSTTPAAEDHSAHMQPVQSQPAVSVPLQHTPELADAHEHMLSEHGASLNFLLLGERFEQADDDTRLWELQGWLGYDYDKLWLKSEGEYDSEIDETEHSELQLLYSRAVAPFWDLQAGLRRDDADAEARTYAAFGLMGLAPYWFEIDAAAFVSEAGDFSTRLEAEYELRLTQTVLLQPRLELNYHFADDAEMMQGKGLSEASFGLRLRYEWRREMAPYIGVEWSRAYGDTAALLRAVGADREQLQVVAGLRVWY